MVLLQDAAAQGVAIQSSEATSLAGSSLSASGKATANLSAPALAAEQQPLTAEQQHSLQYIKKLYKASPTTQLPPPPAHSPWLKPVWLQKQLQQNLPSLQEARLLYQQHKLKPRNLEILQQAFESFQVARKGNTTSKRPKRLDDRSLGQAISPPKGIGAQPHAIQPQWSKRDTRQLKELKRRLMRRNKTYFVLQKPARSLSLSDKFILARYFTKKRQFQKARQFYKQIKKSSPLHLKVKAYRRTARTHKLEQNREAALDELIKLQDFLLSHLKKNFNYSKLLWRNWSHRKKSDYFYVHRFYINSLLSLVYAYWSLEKIPEAQGVTEEVLQLAAQHKKLENLCCLAVARKKGRKRGRTIYKKISLTYLHQHFKLSKIYRLRGKIYMQLGQLDKAHISFQQALQYKITKSDRHQLLWDVAWAYKKQNNLSEGIQILQQLREQADRHEPLKRKYMFWQAYWQQQLGRRDTARQLFEQLLAQPVLSYYSVLAYEQLAEQLSWPLASRTLMGLPSRHIKGHIMPLASSLVKSFPLLEKLKAYPEVVPAYVQHHIKKIKKRERVLVYSYAGLHQKALRSWANLGPRDKAYVVQNYLPHLFPEAYRVDVLGAGQKFQVEPALLYSIMRQESAFHPQARSPMDAFGLMQMLPRVAEKSFHQLKLVARDLTLGRGGAAISTSSVRGKGAAGGGVLLRGAAAPLQPVFYKHEHDLYTPRNSIFLGAVHMAELLKQQGGNRVFSIASYNAGAHVVNKWKKFFAGPDFEFIEDIPYTETRRYTKLVLRNMAMYNHLYAGGVGWQQGRVLQGLDKGLAKKPGVFKGWWSWWPLRSGSSQPVERVDAPLRRASLLPDIF